MSRDARLSTGYLGAAIQNAVGAYVPWIASPGVDPGVAMTMMA